jgi:hypothetical protein
MKASNVIVNMVARLVRERGFSAVGSTFYKDLEELTAAVNLQRSQFGAQYYMNLAWYDRNLPRTTRPKEHQCHVRMRVDRVPGVNEDESKRALDVDATLDDDARRAAVQGIVERACAFLESGGTIAGLREMDRCGELSAAAVLRVMRPRIQA